MDLGEPVVTEKGILRGYKAQCQALINRITVEIDMKLNYWSQTSKCKINPFMNNLPVPSTLFRI